VLLDGVWLWLYSLKEEEEVKRKALVVSASSVVALVMVLSSLISGGRSVVSAAKQPSVSAASKLPPAPAVPGAKADKKYKGQTIVYYGGSVGLDHDTDVALQKRFTKDTGIKVTVRAMPSSSTATLTQLQQVFTAGSSSIDVTRLDTIWPATFYPYLINLRSAFKSMTKLEYSSLIANDTIGGKLVAFPYQGDFGMLYYRKDLLHKYGYKKAPTTWTQLTNMAKKIQAGERKKTANFYGFVFQGSAYEGLTCNALEWINSYGGGTYINSKGKVTFDNAKVKAALNLAKSWVGTISPRGVTGFMEGDVQNAFLGGNAAFARNWPYMTGSALVKGTKVAGKFGVAPLPHGPGGKSSAAVGGWQIAVSKFSKHQGAATAWAKYYASKQALIWRADAASVVPTMPSVGSVKSVKKAMPFLATVGNATQHVVRPSSILKGRYNQGSTYIFQGINQILNGGSVNTYVTNISNQLKNLHP
jgi:trehalose/maltose transport system substrate-binding protein